MTFRTAFIVGFPGETDEAFEELERYVEQAEFDRVCGTFVLGRGRHSGHRAQRKDRPFADGRTPQRAAGGSGDDRCGKNVERIGSTLEVMVDGPAEEDGHWLEGRHERIGT